MARNITSDLSPPVLRGEGLVEALTWLATSMKERFGLTIKLQVDDGLGVPDEAMRTLLFSLVRELLFNVTKHADASEASVSLSETADRLRIVVSDTGKGFDAGELKWGGTGLGLQNADQRLRLFGGEVSVESQPGKGTRVTIEVPLASLNLP